MQLVVKNYAVGQGGMALIRLVSRTFRFNVLYDCGASPSQGSNLRERVKELARDLDGDDVDWLLLSHVHDDHLNGVRILGSVLGKGRVNAVMMPAVKVGNLIIEAVRAFDDGLPGGSAVANRVASMAQSPETVRRFLGDDVSIVQVQGETPEDFGTDGPPPEVPLRPEFEYLAEDMRVQTGSDFEYRVLSPISGSRASGTRVLSVAPEKARVRVRGGDGQIVSIIPHCVDSELETDVGQIFSTLGISTSEDLIRELENPNAAVRLQKVLKPLLSRINIKRRSGGLPRMPRLDLNSGGMMALLAISPRFQSYDCATFYPSQASATPLPLKHKEAWGEILLRSNCVEYDEKSRSWGAPFVNRCPYDKKRHFMWFGDCQIGSPDYAYAVAHRYGSSVLDEVGVAQIPHHGSNSNCNPDHLPGGMQPHHWHVSYGENNSHQHPSSRIVQALECKATVIHLTNRKAASNFCVRYVLSY